MEFSPKWGEWREKDYDDGADDREGWKVRAKDGGR